MHPSRPLVVQVLVLFYGLLLAPSYTLGIPTGVNKSGAARVVAGLTVVDDTIFHTLAPVKPVVSRPFSIQGDGDDDDGQPQPRPTPDSPPPPPPPTPTPTPDPTTQPTPTPTPSVTSTTDQNSVQASDTVNQDGDSLPSASVVTVTMTPGIPIPTTSNTVGSLPADNGNSSVQQQPTEVSPPAAGLAPAMIALISVVLSLAVIVCAGVLYVKYWRRRRRQTEKEFYDPEAGGPSATGSQLSMAQSHISTLPSVMARSTPVSLAGSQNRPSYPIPSDPFSVPTAYNRADVLIMPPMPSTTSTRSQSTSHSANSSLSSYSTRPSHSASSSLTQQPSPPGLTGSSSSAALQAPAVSSPRNPFADGPPSPNPEIRIQPPSLPSSEGSVFSDYDELGSDMFFVPPSANPQQQPGHAY